jgi:hypothetical protein
VLAEIGFAGGDTGDAYLAPQIARVAQMVLAGRFTPLVAELFPTTCAGAASAGARGNA